MDPRRNAKRELDEALARLGRPAVEDLEGARERVGHSLRSQTPSATVEPLDVKSASLWQLRQPYFVLIAAALVLAVSLAGLRNAGSHALATVESGNGSLFRVADEKSSLLQAGATLEPGEVLRTTRAAAIALADGSRVELSSKTEFSIERADDGIRIDLRRGSLVVHAAKQLAGHLYVQTKDVIVSVVGTVFLVNAEAEGSRVAVIEGEVRVQQRTATKNLLRGEQLTTNPRMELLSVTEELSRVRRVEPAEVAAGQSAGAASAREEFAAASIKPYVGRYFTANDFLGFACRGTDGVTAAAYGNGSDPMLHVPQGRCMGDAVQLRYLLYYTFGINQYQLRFGPGASVPPWGEFQIQAASDSPSTATLQQLRQMLQTMVEDRFKLRSHRESQELPGYALVVAKGGAKLKEASGAQEGPRVSLENGQVVVRGKTTLNRFAEWFSGDTRGGLGEAPVVNKTGLTAIYEYEYVRSGGGSGARGASAQNLPPALPGMSPEEHVRYIAEVLGPNWRLEGRAATLSNILEDALGLRLQTEKVTVDMLVIDQVENPTPN